MQLQTKEQKISVESEKLAENRFIIYSTDEDEIIEEIEQKTKLEEEKIKRAIKFRKKEPKKEEIEDIAEEITTAIVQQLPYITKVNGSVIVRLG